MTRQFPVLSLTGPRQSGKTTLLRNEFNSYQYFNLERIDYREMIQADPIGFLKQNGPGIIFDEAQKLPELFSYIQVVADERDTPGQYILSGSESFLLSEKISQSLAGRVNINHLFPFDLLEIDAATIDPAKLLISGFYPRLHNQDISASDFYPSYLQTYIERDIRNIKNVENLHSFSRFIGLCAGRIGQPLNLTSLANDTGVSVNTVKAWISMLEASFIIYLVQPFYQNMNKRIIKSPKLYFYDTGVAASLLRITDPDQLFTHYMYGSLFENLIISEIIKTQEHLGKKISAYYWRESNGTEIDCILETAKHNIALEIKSGQTFTKDYLKNLKKFPTGNTAKSFSKIVLYAGEKSGRIGDTDLLSWQEFPQFLKDL